MEQDIFFIERDGNQLRTHRELQDWYLNKIKNEQSASPDFNVRRFAETERTNIQKVLHEINPTDNKSRTFRKTLFEYVVKVIYNTLHTVMYPIRLPQDIYMGHLVWFDNQFEQITDTAEQKKFIEKEIARSDRNNQDWKQNFDLNDSLVQHVYDAEEMYLKHLILKLTNFQHTELKSSHETLVEKYYRRSYGLGDTEETLLAESLENRLIIEMVGYKHALSDQWMELKPDENYFKKFIVGTLQAEFVEAIYRKVKPLNNHEINRYLTLSLAQFKTFHPAHREKEFILKYATAYWHPNNLEKVHESEIKTAKYLIKEFTPFYQTFIDITEKALADFRAGLIGTPEKNNHQPAIDVNNFFDNIFEGSITKIETYNTAQQLTDNFQLAKLKILLDDFEFYMFNAREEREADCTNEEITEAINKLEEQGKEPPMIQLPDFIKTEKGVKAIEGKKILDLEKLLFPFDFFTCYQFKNLLVSEINKQDPDFEKKGKAKQKQHLASQADKSKNQHSFVFAIKGNKALGKLNDLHDKLKLHAFIADTTQVKPFKKIFSGTKITSPVTWAGTPTELRYFILLIHNEYKIIEPILPSHWKVACKCFQDAKGAKFLPNKLKDLKLPNAKRKKILDDILEDITPHPSTSS